MKQLSRKTIYESEWINLYVDKVITDSGVVYDKYHQLEYPKESVVIIGENSKGHIMTITSNRYTTRKIEIELPSGYLENGETILGAARREFLEETGYVLEKTNKIYSFMPSNSISNQVVHVVFGLVNESKQSSYDTNEIEDVKWMSIDEIQTLINSNKINCGISLMGMMFFKMLKNK